MRAIILAAAIAAMASAAEARNANYQQECDNCSNQSSSLTSKDDAGLAARTWFKAVTGGKNYWDARASGTVITPRGKDIITYSRNKGADEHAQANATPGNYSTGGNWPD